jgi:hypothetical protein
MEDRPRAAGWWLGAALAFQFFAVLAVPLALVLIARRRWWTAVVPMVAVPALFMIVPLLAEPAATLHQLLHQTVYDDAGYITPTWNADPGVAAVLRAAIALASVPAALILARRLPGERQVRANLLLWTLGVLFALRVLEPELVPYFLAPTLALLPISAGRWAWWRLVATGAVAVWLNWWVHVAVQAHWSLWLLLIGQLVVLGWLGWPRGPLLPSADGRVAVEGRAAPVRSGRQRVART